MSFLRYTYHLYNCQALRPSCSSCLLKYLALPAWEPDTRCPPGTGRMGPDSVNSKQSVGHHQQSMKNTASVHSTTRYTIHTIQNTVTGHVGPDSANSKGKCMSGTPNTVTLLQLQYTAQPGTQFTQNTMTGHMGPDSVNSKQSVGHH